MTPEARPRIDAVREFLPTSPLVGHLGIELRELEADRAVLALPFAAHVVTIGDVVHGGAIASLMDTAAMMAAWATDEPAERLAGATVALSIDYVAPARARPRSSPRRSWCAAAARCASWRSPRAPAAESSPRRSPPTASADRRALAEGDRARPRRSARGVAGRGPRRDPAAHRLPAAPADRARRPPRLLRGRLAQGLRGRRGHRGSRPTRSRTPPTRRAGRGRWRSRR